jgi:hypothetical protein
MYPDDKPVLSDYSGPFGIYNLSNIEYQALYYIPFRIVCARIQPPLGEHPFRVATYKAGGRDWRLPWTPLRGQPEFGVLKLRDGSYQRLDLEVYSKGGALGADNWQID